MVNRIEIIGNIASGKSSLARAFANVLGFKSVFEDFDSVITLDDFYNAPQNFAFETELFFTLTHYYQHKKSQGTVFVSDYSLITDYAFAITTLTKREFSAYNKVFGCILDNVGKPTMAIYLHAGMDTLVKRIISRGRNNEKTITESYLNAVEINLKQAIKEKYYDVKIVDINTDNTSINDYDKNMLLRLIKHAE